MRICFSAFRGFSIMLLLIAAISVQARLSVTRAVMVDGVKRTALIYPGKHADQTPSPLVFVFHGFTGTSQDIAGMSMMHIAWPQATVVYPQGLTKWSTRRQHMEPAWQVAPGADNDRDVRFIDTLYTSLCAWYQVDTQRVYAAGSSNGAMFCYVLLAMRPEKFAAFAGVAGAVDFLAAAPQPRPVLMIHGRNDQEIVLARAEATRDQLRKLNGCGEQTREWRKGCLSYQPCTSGQPVLWYLHNGKHVWPDEATSYIVPFFKEHALPPLTPPVKGPA